MKAAGGESIGVVTETAGLKSWGSAEVTNPDRSLDELHLLIYTTQLQQGKTLYTDHNMLKVVNGHDNNKLLPNVV